MQIISGKARNITLDSVKTDDIRPTSGRARKALFDSLGKFDNAIVVDLCAGSGALGLEAASRGAAKLYSVEKEFRHVKVIEKNIEKLKRAGVETEFHLINSDIQNLDKIARFISECDIIFADPPYDISSNLFEVLASSSKFRDIAKDAIIIWEIPDTAGAMGEFIKHKSFFGKFNIRKFGATNFLIAEYAELES